MSFKKSSILLFGVMSLAGCDNTTIISFNEMKSQSSISAEEKAPLIKKAQEKITGVNNEVYDILLTPISGVYEVWTKRGIVYANSDFDFVFNGSLIDIKNKRNLTSISNSIFSSELLIAEEKDRVINQLSSIYNTDNSIKRKVLTETVIPNKPSFIEANKNTESKSPKKSVESINSFEDTQNKIDDLSKKMIDKYSIENNSSEPSDFRKALMERLNKRMDLELRTSSSKELVAQGNVDVSKIKRNNGTLEYGTAKIKKVGYNINGLKISSEDTISQVRTIFSKIKEKGDSWTITYPAIGDVKKSIAVFTDPDCPYCQRLHAAIPELNKRGISVQYLFYPRNLALGVNNPATKVLLNKMESIWCSENPQQAMNDAFNRLPVPLKKCTKEQLGKSDFPVFEHYTLGEIFGLEATPLTITEDGKQIYGFGGVSSLLDKIGI